MLQKVFPAVVVLANVCFFPVVFSAESKLPKANNSVNNQPGQVSSGLNASDQGSKKSDIDLTSKIRKSLIDDKSLSMMAHNVKIISIDGNVVLKGPVENLQEKVTIEAKARDILGTTNNLMNELQVVNTAK